MPDFISDIPTNVWLFGAATVISIAAFIGLILIPAMKAFGQWPERLAAGFLSLFVLATLVTVGGPAAGEDDAGEVILGAMIPRDDSVALFVKFKGDADVARRERGNFVQFVRSVRWN